MKTRSMALYYKRSKSPGPKGGLGPVDINRQKVCNLCCKIGKDRNRAGHAYEPAGILQSAERQPVYIKGRPGGGSRIEKQQLESQAKKIRSLVIGTLAIPSQLN